MFIEIKEIEPHPKDVAHAVLHSEGGSLICYSLTFCSIFSLISLKLFGVVVVVVVVFNLASQFAMILESH